MNEAQISPEIRGLLEELVADPRSSIRLVPRWPLRHWFDSDERVRAREISGTKLERHLIDTHREELAPLLCEASRIAYLKAPVLTIRPESNDGKPFDAAVAEVEWRHRARKWTSSGITSNEVSPLDECLTSIRPQASSCLAKASLSLVPNDRTRFTLALSLPWNRSRTALGLLRRLAAGARPVALVPHILRHLGARLCSVDRLRHAREVYLESTEVDPDSPFGWICAFNLSCFLQEESSAIDLGAELDRVVRKDDPRLIEAMDLLRTWMKSRSPAEVICARETVLRVVSKGYDAVAPLSLDTES